MSLLLVESVAKWSAPRSFYVARKHLVMWVFNNRPRTLDKWISWLIHVGCILRRSDVHAGCPDVLFNAVCARGGYSHVPRRLGVFRCIISITLFIFWLRCCSVVRNMFVALVDHLDCVDLLVVDELVPWNLDIVAVLCRPSNYRRPRCMNPSRSLHHLSRLSDWRLFKKGHLARAGIHNLRTWCCSDHARWHDCLRFELDTRYSLWSLESPPVIIKRLRHDSYIFISLLLFLPKNNHDGVLVPSSLDNKTWAWTCTTTTPLPTPDRRRTPASCIATERSKWT